MIFVILLIAVLVSKEAYLMYAFFNTCCKSNNFEKGNKQKSHILVKFSLRITKIWQVYLMCEQ